MEWQQKRFCYIETYTLFLRVAKNYDKNLKQNISLYYCTISYYFQKQV